MAVNKVVYNGKTLMDVTGNTVTPNKMMAGVTATASDGTQIEGTLDKLASPGTLTVKNADGTTNATYDGSADKTVTLPDVRNSLKYFAKNTGVNVRGVSSTTTTYSEGVLVALKGLVMSGTAQNAGLVTRGICGVTTPDGKGACTKEHLYVNYDGNNAYSRKMVLGAGTPGNAISATTASDSYGMGHQYAAVRGDQMVNYVRSITGTKADASALAAKQDKLTFDSAPTAGSTNPVTSGGIYSAINAVKVDGYTVKKDDSGYYIEV